MVEYTSGKCKKSVSIPPFNPHYPWYPLSNSRFLTMSSEELGKTLAEEHLKIIKEALEGKNGNEKIQHSD
jgi:hypothetical protein